MMFPVVAVVSGRYWAALDDAEKAMPVRGWYRNRFDWLFAQYAEFEPKWLDDLKGTGMTVTVASPRISFGDTLTKVARNLGRARALDRSASGRGQGAWAEFTGRPCAGTGAPPSHQGRHEMTIILKGSD